VKREGFTFNNSYESVGKNNILFFATTVETRKSQTDNSTKLTKIKKYR